MRNTEWNNVPRVVYDCIGMIINSVDRYNLESRNNFRENHSHFGQQRTRIEALESGVLQLNGLHLDSVKKFETELLEVTTKLRGDLQQQIDTLTKDLRNLEFKLNQVVPQVRQNSDKIQENSSRMFDLELWKRNE